MDSRPPNLLLLLLLHFCKDSLLCCFEDVHLNLLILTPVLSFPFLHTQGNVAEDSHVSTAHSCLIIGPEGCSSSSNETVSGYPVLAVYRQNYFYLTRLFFLQETGIVLCTPGLVDIFKSLVRFIEAIFSCRR